MESKDRQRNQNFHRGHTSDVNNVIFHPNQITLASCSDDNTIKLWNTKTGRERKTLIESGLTCNLNGGGKCLVFSPGGKNLITGAHDGTIKFWDVKTGKKRKTIKLQESEIIGIALSPDGKTLAIRANEKRSDKTNIDYGYAIEDFIELRDTGTGKEKKTIKLAKGPVGW